MNLGKEIKLDCYIVNFFSPKVFSHWLDDSTDVAHQQAGRDICIVIKDILRDGFR